MKAVGIICEYNPFHNGHRYQIEQAKLYSGCDAAVCVMSGSAVQRGEVALFDKWTRARTALENGADLVIELPAWYVLQSAKTFAEGGVMILKKSRLVNAISFGSESADIGALKKCARILYDESPKFKENMERILKTGVGYPAALQETMDMLYPEASPILKNPNDMLGVSYLSAMMKCGADFDVFPVKRHMAEHNSESAKGDFASSTAIRNMISEKKDVSKLVPSFKYNASYNMANLSSLILGFYRTACPHNLKNIPGIEDGFENRLVSASLKARGIDEFYNLLTSRRHTLSRVKRLVLSGLIGMEREKECDYIRILGMTDKGAELLKCAKEKTELPFVVKTADFTPGENSTFAYDIKATDIAALSCDDVNLRSGGADYYNSPVKI